MSALTIEWFIIIGLILYIIYKWMAAPYTFFQKSGITFEKPVLFFGNSAKLLLGRENFHELVNRLYRKFPNERFFGSFDMRIPNYFIRDVELIRQITIKDFDHFQDRRIFITEENEPLLARSLMALNGDRWREMRSTLSPAFTGNKMRVMFQLIAECAIDTVENLLIETEKTEKFIPDMKDLFTRFTNDAIATSAFGIKINSWQDKENEFYLMGKKATNIGFRLMIKLFAMMNFPRLCNFLKITMFTNDQRDFYRSLVHDAIRYREKENVIRPDMINLLMMARKGALQAEKNEFDEENDDFTVVKQSKSSNLKRIKSQWEDDDITGQCMLFFFAGFESSAVLLCFTAHELTENQDIQMRLIAEIDEVQRELNGNRLTYEILQKMKYLDMIVSETLRKWPPNPIADRICVKPYILQDQDHMVLLNRNDIVAIPIYGIHRDEQYYENPNKFDPERFSDENKHKIKSCTYLPFGLGPRSCIGNRFALMECKAILFYLLSSFTFEVSEKTQIPLKLAKAGFSVKAEKGFYIHLKPRKKQ